MVDLDGDQIKNPVFDSEEKAFDSYTRYATSHGHVVRKDGVSRDVHGKAIKQGDVRVALSYLKGKTVINPMFYSKIETASNGKLKHLG
ncbi:hypothetical protein HKD37_14G040694 [Glycine soja]